MKFRILSLAMAICIISCTSTKNTASGNKPILLNDDMFLITEISDDPTYGYSSKNPIEVGSKESGPKNERRYLNALTGPNGEPISYFRAGSCCPIKSKKAVIGNQVMLDNYRVTWKGSKDTVSIYINMYDAGELKAPKGMGIKEE